ncbi:methyltransferase family protein [Neolewinella xylanilytica]|uniref:Methyltransferase family protein n=1 Tax=Neolewinella xylanilytica TaxID=1514080 RepID=A0A2S6I915_9BACT|nr:class I SAM-dependent methyltransferase [Neolewinella xylanilytica]PPK87990.1 methyltransferase family protein [Neolewinella xylanilytica]
MTSQQPGNSLKESYIGLRTDIIGMLEGEASATILDVGCATGVNGAYLLDHGHAKEVYGIEYDAVMANLAKDRYREVWQGDIEAMQFTELFKDLRFDCLIFGDILEHLRDPQLILNDLLAFLRPGGRVVISVPNMQHVSALWTLAAKGYWPRNDRGIFDRTHLQVFTRKNLIELVESSGLEVEQLQRVFRYRDRLGSQFPIYGRLLKVAFPDYYTFQYLVLAKKP